jgi:stress response protein YsnF
MTLPAPDTNSVQGFANKTLSAAYVKTARPMLEQTHALFNAQGSRMQQSLKDLDDEAQQLQENDERMTADNAQLQQTLGVYNDTLNTTSELINVNSPSIQETGQKIAVPVVTAKVFINLSTGLIQSGQNPISTQALGFYGQELARIGITWNTPQSFAAGYTTSQAWIDRMNNWGDGYADLARNSILQGFDNGWGPLRTASYMRQTAEGLPVHAAENITRTLQLTSFRDASLAMELANSQAIVKKIRIATLTNTTCLTCVSLHGTEVPLGERVHDHNRGRCSEFYVVPNGPETPQFMQADSLPGQRKFVPYQTGEEWFSGLSPQRQAEQASFVSTPAKLRAFQEGTPLSAFVTERTDDVFGLQVVENSLVGAIGDAAEGFYSINQ